MAGNIGVSLFGKCWQEVLANGFYPRHDAERDYEVIVNLDAGPIIHRCSVGIPVSICEQRCEEGQLEYCAGVLAQRLKASSSSNDLDRLTGEMGKLCLEGVSSACWYRVALEEDTTGSLPLEVLRLLEIACSNGDMEACASAGIEYRYTAEHQDFEKALWLFQKGCESGELDSCSQLAWWFVPDLRTSQWSPELTGTFTALINIRRR